MVITKSILLFTSDAESFQTLTHDLHNFGCAYRVSGQFEETWNLLAAAGFDLVLLDFFSGGDGVSFLQSLRALYPDLPVLIITAPHQVDLRIRCLNIGICDYLVTPLRIEELVARIETILHHRGVDDQRHYLQWAGICLDETGNRIRNGATWLALSPTECKVLATLFKQRGRPASKEYLGELLGCKKPLSINAVEVLIYRLRNRVRPLKLQICTLRGTGYVIEPLIN
jgi:DNA-binding response OmpR family regulator